MTDDARNRPLPVDPVSPTVDLDRLAEPPSLHTPPTLPMPSTAETMSTTTTGCGVLGTDSYIPPTGYSLGAIIGRGGMGEVVAATCQRIGREVAIKRMRTRAPDPDQIARFLREARVQARLDHPAIVPVHELGYDSDGRPYFTMKRLAGVTLWDLLARGKANQQRILRALVEVCLAIELAHTRGIVHRDLKPSNIMLGDYGEVYVLDWGVARVLADHADPVVDRVLIETNEDRTQTGDLLGTPGYIAPEQVRGETITTAVDVYSLGAVLFEVLTGEPLHPRDHAAIPSTLAMATSGPTGPAARKPDAGIPPELDALCLAALATDPVARPRARELAERIERFLDGDRDIARRRALAREQLALALDAFGSADPEARATAMRRAGRALALDPESAEAAALVSRLMLEPPAILPPDLVASLSDQARTAAADRSKKGSFALIGLLSMVVLLPWLDVRSWPLLFVVYGGVAVLAVNMWVAYRRRRSYIVPTLFGALVVSTLFTRVVGPFMLAPIITCGAIMALSAHRWLNDRLWLIIAWTATVAVVPLALEACHVLAPTWGIVDGEIWTRSSIYNLHGATEAVVLAVANAVFTIAMALLAWGIHRARQLAQQQIAIQSWHLRQLLPAPTRIGSTRY